MVVLLLNTEQVIGACEGNKQYVPKEHNILRSSIWILLDHLRGTCF